MATNGKDKSLVGASVEHLVLSQLLTVTCLLPKLHEALEKRSYWLTHSMAASLV